MRLAVSDTLEASLFAQLMLGTLLLHPTNDIASTSCFLALVDIQATISMCPASIFSGTKWKFRIFSTVLHVEDVLLNAR